MDDGCLYLYHHPQLNISNAFETQNGTYSRQSVFFLFFQFSIAYVVPGLELRMSCQSEWNRLEMATIHHIHNGNNETKTVFCVSVI